MQEEASEEIPQEVPQEETASEEVPQAETASEEIPQEEVPQEVSEETVSEEIPQEETLPPEAPAEVQTTQTASTAETAPCYVQVNGQMMLLVNGPLESCARTIKAARQGAEWGHGFWGSYTVKTNSAGETYLNDQYVGIAPNTSSGGNGNGYNSGPNSGDSLYRQNAEYYNDRQLPIAGGQYTGAQ